MTILLGIAGSVRRDSCNAALLRAAASLMPAEAELRIDSIVAIPLYNADVGGLRPGDADREFVPAASQ